jgi:hypothetical protein
VVDVDEVIQLLDPVVAGLPGIDVYLQQTASQLKKAVARGVLPEGLIVGIDQQLADKSNKLYGSALSQLGSDETLSKTHKKAIGRLLTSMPLEQAQHYLSPDFANDVADMVDAASDSDDMRSRLDSAVTNRVASIKFRLNYLAVNRDPENGLDKAIHKTAQVIGDKTAYVHNLHQKSDGSFIESLTDSNVFELALDAPKSFDAILGFASKNFRRVKSQFTYLNQGNNLSIIIHRLLETGPNGDFDKMMEHLGAIEQRIEQAVESNRHLGKSVIDATAYRAARSNNPEVAANAVRAHHEGVNSAIREETGLDLEAFKALDFGQDFAVVLKELMRQSEKETNERLFAGLEKVREQIEPFAETFYEIDGDLRTAVGRAVGERVTEMLYAALESVKSQGDKVSVDLHDDSGSARVATSVNEVMQAIEMVGQALTKINQSMAEKRAQKVLDKGTVKMWNLGDRGDVLLKTRAVGAREEDILKEYEYGSEAQMNFAVNLEGSETVPPSLSSPLRDRALSIRIDLEGRLLSNDGEIIGYDPTREVLNAAFDIGSLYTIEDTDNNPNQLVGSAIAVGNRLRAEQLKRDGRGYHTSLDAKFGKSLKFEQMVGYLNHKIDAYATGLGRSPV